ncbi:hypothetical protein IWW54_000912 [Coemansia sp. RSA 2705]|nr:hypothetical protein IWW54_000912 [Coemansia sp. RSA 2705]
MADMEALARKHWLGDAAKWSDDVAARVLKHVVAAGGEMRPRVQQLERQQYLERYVWPHYDRARESPAAALTLLLVANEKQQQGLESSLWTLFSANSARFDQLFDDSVALLLRAIDGTADADAGLVRLAVVQFLIVCFGALEVDVVRAACLRLVGVSVWYHLLESRRERELAQWPQVRRLWRHASRRWTAGKRATAEEAARLCRERDVIARLVWDAADGDSVYVEKVVELLVDLGSQLPTRRFVGVLLDDMQAAELLAPRVSLELARRLRACVAFPVSDVGGQPLAPEAARAAWYRRAAELQLAAYKLGHGGESEEELGSGGESNKELESSGDADELATLWAGSAGLLGSTSEFTAVLQRLSEPALRALAAAVNVRLANPRGQFERALVERLLAARYAHFEPEPMGVYPDEQLLYGRAVTAADAFGRDGALYAGLPLPKLGLQYLSVLDYLQRWFALLRVEMGGAVRTDLDAAVTRMQPCARDDDANAVGFAGWTRMALPISALAVVDVQRARVGEHQPSRVRADLSVDLSGFAESLRAEWAEVRVHDVLVLAQVRADGSVARVRGCTVDARLDAQGSVVEQFDGSADRGFRVALDPAQYARDTTADPDVYAALNVVMRRRAAENNFTPVLETVRALAAAPPELPAWLRPIFLGYGDPAAAVPRLFGAEVNLGDTFVSADHAQASFAQYASVEVAGEFAEGATCVVAYPEDTGGVVRVTASSGDPAWVASDVQAPRRNALAFTPAQVHAIASAQREGLTLVVGPPGTGKTDVAVQLVSALYHAQPGETILLVTHSNQALNQLFAKIVALDIEPRHLLRLGHGEAELDADERFSRAGRIESFLDRRLELLAQVARLAASLDVPGEFGDSCASARFFLVAHVRVRWEAYRRGQQDVFPFERFFEAELGRPLFPPGCDAAAVASGCYAHLERMFDELAAVQPFELLRGSAERSRYLLARQARIVAMTCTHAAMRQEELARAGVRFSTVVVEEAAQMLDIEAFVPLTLAPALKRLVLIGDHNQLPPVVQSPGLRAFARMEQSLFARLVRLGVPYVELDRQARARPEIAALYRFRYRGLGDLQPHVAQGAFAQPNPGFKHAFQFVNVGQQQQGESEPTPHFFQNLAEAEFVVAVFRYMCAQGYDARRVALLAAYNGQRMLLLDVLRRRCPELPMPRVSTVDQFQGQQADYVLLSLVRTRRVGHLRDLRRLTVALSRARLGLYVFGCRALLDSCFELQPVMAELLRNGDALTLVPEGHQSQPVIVDDVDSMAAVL